MLFQKVLIHEQTFKICCNLSDINLVDSFSYLFCYKFNNLNIFNRWIVEVVKFPISLTLSNIMLTNIPTSYFLYSSLTGKELIFLPRFLKML